MYRSVPPVSLPWPTLPATRATTGGWVLLPTESRLKAKRDFQAVFSRRRSLADPLLALYAAPGRGKCTRFGFSVGKKLGGAVRRNRVKRLLREAARHLLPEIARDLDMVIVARIKAKDATLADLSDSLDRLLCRANAKSGARTG